MNEKLQRELAERRLADRQAHIDRMRATHEAAIARLDRQQEQLNEEAALLAALNEADL